jgi:hypothetical protein
VFEETLRLRGGWLGIKEVCGRPDGGNDRSVHHEPDNANDDHDGKHGQREY